MKPILILSLGFVFSGTSLAGEDHAPNAADPRFGAGKAIEAFDKEQGFKLSERAAKNLGVNFETLKGPGPWKIPKTSLVQLKQSFGVYRKYDGWISFVLISIVKDEGTSVLAVSEDLEANDEVAMTGASFLRMTDSDLNAGTVDSCAH